MYVVKLNGDIIKEYNKAKITYLKSLGFFVTDFYIYAVNYANALLNRGRDNRKYKYAEYF